MNRELAELGGRIDAVFFCPHGPDDGCRCRKPLPGLFETDRRALRHRPLRRRTLVGDSLRDLQAGAAAGCEPHLVRTGKGARARRGRAAPRCRARCRTPQVHADLAGFAQHLIQRERIERGDAAEAGFGVRRLH